MGSRIRALPGMVVPTRDGKEWAFTIALEIAGVRSMTLTADVALYRAAVAKEAMRQFVKTINGVLEE